MTSKSDSKPYTVRRPAINERLAAVARADGPSLLKETDDRERPLETFAVGIRWERYTQEDLLEIVEVRPTHTDAGDRRLTCLHTHSAWDRKRWRLC